MKKAVIDKTDKKKRLVTDQGRLGEEYKVPISVEKIKKTRTISKIQLIKQNRKKIIQIK